MEDNIELRSEEVQEILSKMPHWMIRWGNLLMLLILLCVLALSWIIKYPDIISTNIIITTQLPPEKIVARSDGRIVKIFVTNNETVFQHQPLAIIENTADYNEVFQLKKITDTLKISNISLLNFGSQTMSYGEIDAAFAVFQKDLITYKLNSDLHPYKIEGTAQNYERKQLQDRLLFLTEQKEISEKELILKKNELERYRKLFDKGVIAAQEWDTKNMEYLQLEKTLRTLNTSISQAKSSINGLDKDSKTTMVNETKDNTNFYRNVVLSYSQLKKAIADWELKYVLRSSISGKVSFLQIWVENQTIGEGENIFTIIPKDENQYLGKIKAPALNSGKIRVGQDINIRLTNFPDREFGIIKGKIKDISLIPDKDGNILIDVILPNKLKTSYNKKIYFQQEMAGTADIITDDLRLIERLLYQFRGVFSREKSNSE